VRRFTRNYRSLIVVVALIAVAGGASVMSGGPQAAPRGYSVVVNIEGRNLGGWSKVSGLDVAFDIVEFREGGGPTRYLPGRAKYTNIKLERAFTGDTGLSDWFTAFSQAPAERVRGTIVMYNAAHTEVARWNFENAWPQKLTGPVLNAGANDVPIESIELVHEGLTRVPPPAR
jgi:phage tail-like protein